MNCGQRLFLFASCILILPSCTLVTENPPAPLVKPGTNVVINEIFTLPESNQRTYSWIELLNPTDRVIATRGWKIAFTTNGNSFRVALDDSGRVVFFQQLQQGRGEWEIPLGVDSLRPGSFITLVNNRERLLSYTDYGPGQGIKVELDSLYIRIVTARGDTTGGISRPDTLLFTSIRFLFAPSDQIILRNNAGQTVDAVRYGNYTYTGSGSDPTPNNRSLGLLPEYQSFARYNGYYTGNSADDFYITGVQISQTRPIPHWHSQAYKK